MQSNHAAAHNRFCKHECALGSDPCSASQADKSGGAPTCVRRGGAAARWILMILQV